MSQEAKLAAPQRSVRLLLIVLVSVGLVARLALAFIMDDDRATRLPESAAYLAIGRSVAAGHGFVLPEDAAEGRKLAHCMPGYPLILAAAQVRGETSIRAVLILQAFAAMETLMLVAWAASRLAGPWAAVVAAAMLTFDPFQVYFSAQVVPVTVLALALAAVMLAGVKCLEAVEAGRRSAWLWAALGGLALAAAAYLEAWAAGLIVPAAVAALVSKRRKRLLAGWAVATAVLVVALAPWLVRNASSVGAPLLTTDLGARPSEGTGAMERPAAWLAAGVARAGQLWSPGRMLTGDDGPLRPVAGYTSLLPTAALAVAGLVALRRRAAGLWLLLAPVYVTLVHVVLPGPGTDRLVVMPSLAVLAGVGLVALLGRGQEAARPAAAAGDVSQGERRSPP